MNWVPLLFIDDVCHRLRHRTFNQVCQLSGSWSNVGSKHHKKRREFAFRCELNGNQEMRYCIWETDWLYREVTVEDLSLEFDRITYFACSSAVPNDTRVNRVSLREFERDILPTIAPLVTNCRWPFLTPQRRDQNRFFFNAFKNCPGFNSISVQEQGQESREFVIRQVEIGNVQRLSLSGTGRWPKEENLGETLKIFVSSARFHALISPDFLIDDSELFELFFERALAGELKRGARIDTTNCDKNRLLALHPDCRHDSRKDAWRIPASNLRIALRHFANVLEVESE